MLPDPGGAWLDRAVEHFEGGRYDRALAAAAISAAVSQYELMLHLAHPVQYLTADATTNSAAADERNPNAA